MKTQGKSKGEGRARAGKEKSRNRTKGEVFVGYVNHLKWKRLLEKKLAIRKQRLLDTFKSCHKPLFHVLPLWGDVGVGISTQR